MGCCLKWCLKGEGGYFLKEEGGLLLEVVLTLNKITHRIITVTLNNITPAILLRYHV